MRFSIVSLFPEFFDSPLSTGLMAKARESGVVDFEMVNPRDFATDRHRTVDDKPYGGGPGMVMEPGVAAQALESIENPGRMLLLTPRGRPLDQDMARQLAKEKNLTLVCGRYEGIDARVEELFPIEPVSVGDFVLNGGETGALCLIEAVSRLLPDFMGKQESGDEESFSSGLLEYPHYTRPDEFRGIKAPEPLLSGDHGRIARWRREQALETTIFRRPDLIDTAVLEAEDAKYLRNLPRKRLGKNLYLALVHYPVVNKFGEIGAVSLTNLDIHDMSRVSRSYGLGGFFIVTPLEDQQELARNLTRHWVDGAGAKSNPDRAEALGMAHVAETLRDAVDEITQLTGMAPKLLASSARTGGMTSVDVREWLDGNPVLLILGTASGLADEVLDMADQTLRPLRFMDGYNHLPVRSAASVMVDRILGDVF